MVKILICCASGSGTSMLIKLNVERACKKIGLEAKVSHAPISEGKSSARNYDVVMTTLNFVKSFESVKATGTKVIGLQNPMSEPEIIKHLTEAGYVQ